MNEDPPTVDNVLLVHSGAMGDFILTLRVVQALRLSGTRRLTVLGRAFYRRLVGPQEGVDRILDIDVGGFHTLFAEEMTPHDKVLDILRPFDLAINMLGEPGGALCSQLSRAGIPRVITIDPRPRADWQLHISDQWLFDLRSNGINATPGPPVINATSPPSESRASPLRHGTLIHPGSGSVEKCWPLDRFLAVGRQLSAEGRPVRFLLGPAELDRLTHAEVDRIESVAPALQPSDLAEVASAISSQARLIGNDSGISHLAAAVGTPTLAVFGPTSPDLWRPLGDHVSVAHSPGRWPEIQRVLGLLKAK